MINAAKITIVLTSLLAGVVGFVWLKFTLNKMKE
jgi:Na+/H+ antiporter NhaA